MTFYAGRSENHLSRSSKFNLVFSACCLLGCTTLLFRLILVPPSDQACIRQSIIFKRAAEAVSYQWVNFGDYLYPASVYRHKSAEQEPAWEKLMTHDVISVTKREMSELNLPKDKSWKKLPDGGVAAVVGVQHQLNCLNLLRRHVHLDLDHTSRLSLRKEADQCLELLRLQVMCVGDATPFLELSVPTHAGNKPDLRTMHKCRKYDDLRNWWKQHSKGTYRSIWDGSE